LNNKELNEGLWDQVILTSKFLEKLPMKKIAGNALSFNNYKNDKITGHSALLSTLIGDVEIPKDVSYYNACLTGYVISKAKSVGRLYEDFIINGDTSEHPTQFEGLKRLTPEKNTFKVDYLNHITKIQGSKLYDFLLVNRSFFLENKDAFIIKSPVDYLYNDSPIYITDWIEDEFIPENIWQKCRQWLSTKVSFIKPCKANYSTVYLGKFDDGSMTKGISGIYGSANILSVESLGAHRNKDADVYRIKGYLGLAVFNADDIVKVRIKM